MNNICKIAIFGTGQSAESFVKSLNTKEYEIVVFIDNNIGNDNSFFDKRVVPPNTLSEYTVDYIVICSEYYKEILEQLNQLGYDKNKIYYSFGSPSLFSMALVQNSLLEKKIFDKNLNEVEVIISGLSYFYRGINEERIPLKTINLSFPSQDLYYDYNVVKFFLQNNKSDMIQYAIVGLSYYSFYYDLSLSRGWPLVFRYSMLKDYENLKLDYKEIKKTELFFNMFDMKKATTLYKESIEESMKKHILQLNDKELEQIKETSLKHSNKKYLTTFEENKHIFKRYLNLLLQNNIKPIIVIPPVSTYYAKYFSEDMIDVFYSIINYYREKYPFDIFDYFYSEIFSESNFYDGDHLNSIGAEKFTNQLIKDLKLF